MRFVVLLFGLIGFLLTFAVGFLFLFFEDALRELKHFEITVPEILYWSPMGTPLPDAGLFAFIAAGYALLGTLLAFFRRGKQGAMLMLIPVLGAAFMNPMSLIFSGILILTAFASFFIGPLPLNAPESDEGDED